MYKTPDDGLSNESDEDKLGVKYIQITSHINGEGTNSPEVELKIKTLHEKNLHKFNIPTYKKDSND